MNSMKRQNYRTLKDELPRSVGTQYAIGDQWRNNSRKNEEAAGGGGLVTKSCPTLAAPWSVARQAPQSMEFSMQEYWSGLPFPSPGDLPNLGIKPGSLAL